MNERLSIRDLWLSFGGHQALRGIDLELGDGEIGALMGPSGCGKSSLLRCIAGFQRPERGVIRLHGIEVEAPSHSLVPERRRVGMVFQDLALFPHLDVASNIAFGLRGVDAAQRRARVREMLAVVGLPELERRYPHQLSGGQQQRIALARALAPRPEILLLDEPFSKLEANLREQLAADTREILKQLDSTALLVTHDQTEAFAVADRVGVMESGRLCQWANGYTIYHQPTDRFVAEFVGQGCMLAGQPEADGRIATALGSLRCAVVGALGERMEVLVRPDDLVFDPNGPLTARVVGSRFRGADYLYELSLDSGVTLQCLAPSHQRHSPGEQVRLRLEGDGFTAFALAE